MLSRAGGGVLGKLSVPGTASSPQLHRVLALQSNHTPSVRPAAPIENRQKASYQCMLQDIMRNCSEGRWCDRGSASLSLPAAALFTWMNVTTRYSLTIEWAGRVPETFRCPSQCVGLIQLLPARCWREIAVRCTVPTLV
eukprot:5949628-Amphidinium_carterae.1